MPAPEPVSEPALHLEMPDAALTDADRDALIAGLRTAVGDDLVTLEEFAERAGLVYAATTRREGADACRGIERAVPAAWSSAPAPAPAPASVRRAPMVGDRSRAGRAVVSIFGSNVRKGRWRASAELRCLSLFGSTTLDFREATYDKGCDTIRVSALALFGSVDVVVPEGVDASLQGIAIFGSKDMKVARQPVIPETPLIEVRATVVFGSVVVRTKGKAMADRVRRALGALIASPAPLPRPPTPPD